MFDSHRKSRESAVVPAILLVIALVLASGCASVRSLPSSAAEVSFGGAEGKTGWSEYEQVAQFPTTDRRLIYDAAKAGLAHADFALRKADINKGVLIGEHGITFHDWNVVAGVYFREGENWMDV